MRVRPDLPIDNRTKQEWETRYAIEIWNWFCATKNRDDDYDLFLDEQWNLQVGVEDELIRVAS